MTLIDYFVAVDDADACRVEPGNGGPEAYGFMVLPAKGVDPCVAAGTLETLLTGRPCDALAGDVRYCRPLGVDESDTSCEASVITVTDTLRDAVAAADAPTLAAVAAAWAETEDMRGVAAAVLGEFLTLFAELASEAVDRGARLCCWWAL
jgi:hypothetical protein